MKVRFLNLSVNDVDERKNYLDAIEGVLKHGQLVIGPEVGDFERKIEEFYGSKYAVGVSSGTDALFIGLKALGIKEGDEVIVTPMSFVASANAISLAGAVPVFADIGTDLNIDPDCIVEQISPRTKAIMPVHYGGKMADMPNIMEIGEKHGLHVVEDASQAFGANLKGKKAGTFGKIGCISLNPMKLLAALGEAGVILTDEEDLRNRVESLRYNGLIDRSHCHWIGTNGRLDTIQAAILIHKLKNVEQLIKKRKEIANYYTEKFSKWLTCPKDTVGEHVYYSYTILCSERDELKDFLTKKGIEVKIYHPVIPDEPAYKAIARGSFQNARKLFNQKLCLPCHENMSQEEVEFVVDSVSAFYESR